MPYFDHYNCCHVSAESNIWAEVHIFVEYNDLCSVYKKILYCVAALIWHVGQVLGVRMGTRSGV